MWPYCFLKYTVSEYNCIILWHRRNIMHLKLKLWHLKKNFALSIICQHTLTHENIAALSKVICRQIKLVDKYFVDIGNLYVKARYHLLAQTEPCISIIKLYWALQKPHTNIWNNKKQCWAIWITSHNISNHIAQCLNVFCEDPSYCQSGMRKKFGGWSILTTEHQDIDRKQIS